MPDASILPTLLRVIAERKANPPAERSYVVSLLDGGTAKIGSKITEEAAEVVEAAASRGRKAGRIWSARSPTSCSTRWSSSATRRSPGPRSSPSWPGGSG